MNRPTFIVLPPPSKKLCLADTEKRAIDRILSTYDLADIYVPLEVITVLRAFAWGREVHLGETFIYERYRGEIQYD